MNICNIWKCTLSCAERIDKTIDQSQRCAVLHNTMPLRDPKSKSVSPMP